MKRIVVCGATGQQGGAVVNSLLTRGTFHVVGLSRNPEGECAAALRKRGVEVARADLDDRASLTAAFAGADGVFGVTQPWDASYRRADSAKEIAQGESLLAACATQNVGHLVLPTALHFAADKTGIPHVDSKIAIEKRLRATNLRYTILRPGTFMDNIGQPFFPVKRGKVRGFADGDAKLLFAACRDIGEAAAQIFSAPEPHRGKVYGVLGTFASGADLCAALSDLNGGAPYRYSAAPRLLMRLFAPEFYEMRKQMEAAGRPPFPQQEGVERALKETRELVAQPWDLRTYLEAKGYAMQPASSADTSAQTATS